MNSRMKPTKILLLLGLSALAASSAGAATNEAPFFVEMLSGLREGGPDSDPVGWAAFFGRFHMMVLHLPIGLLIATFGLEMLGLFRRKQDVRIPSRFLLGLTVLATWVAVATGLLLSLEEYRASKSELLGWHGTGALILAVLLTIAYFVKRSLYKRATAPEPQAVGGMRMLYVPLILMSMGLVSLVGHYGGSLVHGDDFLSTHAPEWVPEPVTKALGGDAIFMPGGAFDNHEVEPSGTSNLTPENGSDTEPEGTGVTLSTDTYFASIIQPIFQRSCLKCHGGTEGKKPKADYDMTSYKGIMEAIEPGDADKSFLVESIELPLDDDEHMPPENKAPQLSDLEKEQVRWWVENGAKERGSLADAPEKLQQLPAAEQE